MAGENVRDPKTGLFIKGHKGGGRPKGSRNKLGEAFLEDMYVDWAEHGKGAIKQVREERPDMYLKVVASILPKDLNVNINPLEEATDEELIQRLKELESVIRPFIGPEGGAEDSDGAGQAKPH